METRVHLCRRLEVEWAGERLESALPGIQGRLLFAYLVLHRDRLVRRDELLEVLWPGEAAPSSPEAVLSSPLSRLRKALGPGRLVGRGELSLTLPPTAWIDWEAAFGGLREAHAAVEQERWREGIDAARAALEIADGGLLPGLEADWIDAKRAELADLRLELLELVAACGIRLGGGELPACRAGGARGGRGGAVPRVRARGADRGAAGARQRRRRPACVRGRPHAAARRARRSARATTAAAPRGAPAGRTRAAAGHHSPGPAGGGALGSVVGGADPAPARRRNAGPLLGARRQWCW